MCQRALQVNRGQPVDGRRRLAQDGAVKRSLLLLGLLLAVPAATAVGGGVAVAVAAPLELGGQRAPPRPDRHEFSLLPAVTADSDRGYGFGFLAILARFARGYAPFRWRLNLLVYMTAKPAPDGAVELPYHDHHVKLELPGLLEGRLRLDLGLAFGRFITSGYYGLGNAAPPGRGGRDHQYDRIYPHLEARARFRFTEHLQLLGAASFTYNWINPYAGSKLERDLQSGDAQLLGLLRGTQRHAAPELTLGLLWDSRDHEYAPSRGMLHELAWRQSPGWGEGSEVAFGGLTLAARAYHPLLGDRLVLAWRVLADLLVGRPPFYELALHGGLHPAEGIGGGKAVRGVPLHRYHGKIKLLGNLELRARLIPLTLFSQRFYLGAVAFADAGRSWVDYDRLLQERFDGTGVGLKVGLGGGVRIQWGETVMIRIDLAWSPDAEPVGAYFDLNHVF
jgi:hypothetical protein